MRTTRSHGTLLEGECDFILLEPERGLLFVEVKGGSLVFDGEKWVREVGAERRELNKDPFAQAQRGMHDIVDIVRGRYGATAKGLPFTYGFAVAFPDCRVSGWLPPSIQRELILDAAKLRAVPDSLRRIFASFARRDDRALHSDEVASVREALYPKYRLVPVLWRKIEDQEERLRRLTDEQQRILDILAQRPKAAISGVAGSGKTLLALAKAQAMARQGFHTLLLCFNRPLKDWLCDSVPQEFGGKLVIDNYHGLADDLCRAAGVPMWERGDTDDPEFWSEVVPVALDEACTRLGPEHKFDAIVVDEGQDFQDLWWESLQSVFRDAANKACYYVFYDPKQQNLFVDHRTGRRQRGEGRTGDHPKGAPTNAHLLCCRLSTYARYAFEATPRIWTRRPAVLAADELQEYRPHSGPLRLARRPRQPDARRCALG